MVLPRDRETPVEAADDQPAPEVVMRGRCGRREAVRDRDMLRWIGRFRFVTAAELSLRFGVTERRINSRVARLMHAGLVAHRRESMFHARVLWLTARGAAAVELPARKPPRADTQIRHELAVARLAAEIELPADEYGLRLWTERECRQADDPQGRRWCVEVMYRGEHKRWPDLVVEGDGMRRAIELEFAIKHTRRLQAIIDAYARDAVFDEVIWLVEQPRHLDRITSMIGDAARRAAIFTPARGVRQIALPWPQRRPA